MNETKKHDEIESLSSSIISNVVNIISPRIVLLLKEWLIIMRVRLQMSKPQPNDTLSVAL